MLLHKYWKSSCVNLLIECRLLRNHRLMENRTQINIYYQLLSRSLTFKLIWWVKEEVRVRNLFGPNRRSPLLLTKQINKIIFQDFLLKKVFKGQDFWIGNLKVSWIWLWIWIFWEKIEEKVICRLRALWKLALTNFFSAI